MDTKCKTSSETLSYHLVLKMIFSTKMLLSALFLICVFDYTSSYQKPRDLYNIFSDVNTSIPLFNVIMNPKWGEPYFDLSIPNNLTALVGKSAFLSCRVRNLGNKTVSWIRHRDIHILTVGTYTYTTDQRFQTTFHRDINEWTLQIKWAQERDAGMYECQISTQPVKSFSVQLNVVDPEKDFYSDNPIYRPYNDEQNGYSSRSDIQNDLYHHHYQSEDTNLYTPRVATATIFGGPDIYVSKGSTINLTCVIRFSPEPPVFIFWHHHDKAITPISPKIEVQLKTVKKEITFSTLTINDADLLDSGKYTCTPSNADDTSVRVHVISGEHPAAMQTAASTILSARFALTLILSSIVSFHTVCKTYIEKSHHMFTILFHTIKHRNCLTLR